MLEILALLSLVRYIEAIATRKGQKPYRWRLITVGAWFGSEFAGAFLTYLVSGNILVAYVAAILCAISSYFYVRYRLNQMPDKQEEWIEQIGKEPSAV